MPTLEHHGLVDMFRDKPLLAPHLVETLFRLPMQPLVIGPEVVPEVLDAEVARREPELAVLSAMIHRDGPNGLAVAEMALRAVLGLDQSRATMYFRMVFDGLKEPVQWAVRRMWMEQQMGSGAKATFPPFLQELIDRGELKGREEGERKGELEGERKGKRDTLIQLLRRARIALTDEEAARIATCEDVATLDRWVGNVLGAKTSADVFAEEPR